MLKDSIRNLFAVTFLCCNLPGCVTNPEEHEQIKIINPQKPDDTLNSNEVSIETRDEKARQPEMNYDCYELPMASFVPFWSFEGQFYITRIIKSCISVGNNGGYLKGSPWVAMGIPCTGKTGTVSVKGRRWEPKSVQFPFTADCPMAIDKTSAQDIGSAVINIPDVNLIALTPASIIYWDLLDYKIARPGKFVTLTPGQLLKEIWPKFMKGQVLKVKLLATENSWYGRGQLYVFEGVISYEADLMFNFKVSDSYPIRNEMIKGFINKCQQTRPLSKCQINI